MIAAQVMGNDVAVGIGGAGGHLEMNVYKPLIINNILQSIRIMSDGCKNFQQFLVENTVANESTINQHLNNSLMLVTALSPVIGYHKAAKAAHYAFDHDLSLKEACLKLQIIDAETFDQLIDAEQMTKPR